MDGKPERVKAKSVHQPSKKTNNRELWATVCFYYPQYDLKEASRLSIRDIRLLLKIAERENAKFKYDLTQIAAAPHTKKGSGVKKLTEHYQKTMQ